MLYISLNIHTPTRVTDVNSSQPGDDKSAISGSGGDEPSRWSISSEVVRPDQDVGARATWPGAGVYYLAVHTAYTGDRFPPPRSEIPFTFTATIDGHGAAEHDRHADAHADADRDRTATPAATRRGVRGRRRPAAGGRGRVRRRAGS